MSFAKLCRSCMKEVESWEFKHFNETLVDMFMFCTQVQVTIEDDFPKHFCCNCTSQIENSYKFIRKAQEINEVYRSIIQETGVIKTEQSSDVFDNTEFKVENNYQAPYIDLKPDLSQEINSYLEGNSPNTSEIPIEFNSTSKPVKYKNNKTKSNYIANKTKSTQTEDFSLENDFNNEGLPDMEQRPENEDVLTEPNFLDQTEFPTHKSKLQSRKRKVYTKDKSGDETVESKDLSIPNVLEQTDVPTVKSRLRARKSKVYTNDESGDETVDTEHKNRCPICQHQFVKGSKGAKYLKTHLKKHSTKNMKVNKVFKQTRQPKCATTDREIKECVKCQKLFKSELWLTRHIQREHPATPISHQCPFCSKTFTTNYQLYHHKYKEHVECKKFVCNACGKRFKMRKQLAVHALTHSTERPFICDHCHMSFKMKHVLVNHLQVHDNNKKFLCSDCGRSFAKKAILEEHSVTHTGKRPYACKHCDYRFGYRSALRSHYLSVHSEARPHICSYCQKGFKGTDVLKRHIRTHTGERPFKCPQCPLGFIDTWRRKLHLMNHHHLSLAEIPKLTRDGSISNR